MKIRWNIKSIVASEKPRLLAEHVLHIFDPDGKKTDTITIATPAHIQWWRAEVRRRARAWNGTVGNYTILEFVGPRLRNVHTFSVVREFILELERQNEHK